MELNDIKIEEVKSCKIKGKFTRFKSIEKDTIKRFIKPFHISLKNENNKMYVKY